MRDRRQCQRIQYTVKCTPIVNYISAPYMRYSYGTFGNIFRYYSELKQNNWSLKGSSQFRVSNSMLTVRKQSKAPSRTRGTAYPCVVCRRLRRLFSLTNDMRYQRQFILCFKFNTRKTRPTCCAKPTCNMQTERQAGCGFS